MKLLSAQQIHDWDAFTIANEPINAINLMERAAMRCTQFILDRQLISNGIKIFCGKGNNGGDGLAIARRLIEAGMQPYVYILEFGAKGTEDFQTNLARLHSLTINIHFVQSSEFFPQIQPDDIIIDALYGSGLNRPLKDLSEQMVQYINQSGATIVSIDVPSGMFIDKSSRDCPVVKATWTLTFQSLKLCFMMAENAVNFGQVHVLDIGLLPEYMESVEAPELITLSIIRSKYKKRTAFSHKGNFGHALLVAGNKGKIGAAIMAAKACLKTGAGLVTVHTNECFFDPVHAALPEAMCVSGNETVNYSRYSAIGIGPGIGTDEAAAETLLQVLEQFQMPIVIDADALNILSSHKEWLEKIPARSVITPHPKEYERLFGKSANEFERMKQAEKLSIMYSVVIVLKGHFTMITANGRTFFNPTGNAGMAKGGSGDVLTGMITALIAQGYDPLSASTMGVYMHGLAADIASHTIALESMLATDIIDHISDSFLELA